MEKPTFGGENNSSAETPAQAAPQTQQASAGASYQQQQSVLAMLNGAATMTASGSRTNQSAAEVKAQLEKLHSGMNINAHQFKPLFAVVDTPDLKIPAVVMYVAVGDSLFHYSLVLEACGEKLTMRTKPGLDGNMIEIDMPTARYFDSFMTAEVERTIKADLQGRGFPVPPKFTCMGNAIVPGTMKIAEDEGIQNLAPYYDAAIAAFTARARIMAGRPTSDITGKMLSSSDIQLVARHEISPGATDRTRYGTVVASDFNIKLVARAMNNQGQQQNIHQSNGEAALSKVQGYIDFAYRGPDANLIQQKVMSPAAAVMTTPCYDPYIVLTNVSPLGEGARTSDNLLTQLLGVASVAGIASDMRWGEIFTRSSVDTGTKTTLGAFGLEHDPFMDANGPQNKPEVLKVSSTNVSATKGVFTPSKIIQMFCYPSMTVALDVVQGGPLDWLQRGFVTSSLSRGSKAEEVIINELNAFSGGLFSQIWNAANPIFAGFPTEVHMGHYTDEKGTQRDIRSLDYLTMLLASEGDKSIMETYSNGFRPGTDELDIDKKRRLIKNYCPNVVFTGMATRVYFSSAFINALDKMLTECGLRITFEGLNTFNQNNQRQSMFAPQFAGHINSGAFQYYGAQQQTWSQPVYQPNGGLFG